MAYQDCIDNIKGKLHSLPPKWAEDIACNICRMIEEQNTCNPPEANCDFVKKCETTTALSSFSLAKNQACITYMNEKGMIVKRCFNFPEVTDEINETNGICLSSSWGSLAPDDKWQLLVDRVCFCCDPTTTTTTSTTTTIAPVTTTTTTLAPTTTTSTTTTTTFGPCRCYSLDCDPAIDRFAQYIDCEGVRQGTVVTGGTPVYVCAQENSITGFGVIVTLVSNNCLAGCGPTITTTTTTTTTSTTTTTTAAPTTTTTTSTTTTTTAAPPVQDDFVYFTNAQTSGDRGAKIWFSQQDYYTPNTPSDLIAPNCLNISDLGTAPPITVSVDFWQDDVLTTIDNGSGGVRTPDGTKTVTISSDLLVYNGSSGAWQKSSSVFTLGEGLNIAAFRITSVTANYLFAGINHVFHLPPALHFIRCHNTFSEGGTGVTWFDLLI